HRIDALGRQLVFLVLHQCDEWADDDRKSRKEKRGELVYEGFPATRRHHDESVSTFEKRFYGIPLSAPEIGMTEPVHQHGAGGLLRNWLLHTLFLEAGTIPTRRGPARAYIQR